MSEQQGSPGVTRRELLRSAAAVPPALLLAPGALASAAEPARQNLKGMNVVMFITDQDRAIQHFPPGWAEKNLPGLTYLRRNGLKFNNAVTDSCMCSPARATLMSGYFPAQHGVKYTLELNMTNPKKNPQVELPTDLPNIASVMAAAGYQVVYKGKWHCSKPRGREWKPSDVGRYGFDRWDPPDAGANLDLSEAGGGYANNDGRFMTAAGNFRQGAEGALDYLQQTAAKQQPFFMIISLVNPHDVLFYPKNYRDAGYFNLWLEGNVGLPETVHEDLSTKPSVQRQFLRISNAGLGPLVTRRDKLNYINFYANLMRASDANLVEVIKTLRSTGLLDKTLIIRTADHGEMGLAHDGLRQKNFNFYEETLRVPLIYSNPKLFRSPRTSNSLVSHVDFLPTIASLFGAPRSARAPWQGVDYSREILNPRAPASQDYVVFTYDDYQSGQKNGPYPKPPNHIVSLREQRWKLAKYYDLAGNVPNQWEMYDLKADPLETTNLAHPGYKRTAEQQAQYVRLKAKLARIEKTRLGPL
ncbi:MAG: sulfatase-like hydrolase/transferase [Solirubrobacterales bacterium]|nr:sulfatase-like hydrolase/transferase [Solirubrobacterales bacterium]